MQSACDKLAQIDIANLSSEKTLKYELVCNKALVAKGVPLFEPNSRKTFIHQLEDLFEHLLKRGRIKPKESQDMVIRTAELASLLIRLRRRWQMLMGKDKNYFMNSRNPTHQALYKSAIQGILYYPSTAPTARDVAAQKNIQIENKNAQITKVDQESNQLQGRLQQSRKKLQGLEDLEDKAKKCRQNKSSLMKKLKMCKENSVEADMLLQEIFDLEDQYTNLAEERKTLIQELRKCRSKVKEDEKCLKLLEEARRKLESCALERKRLKKDLEDSEKKCSQYAASVCSMSKEIQTLQMENSHLQESNKKCHEEKQILYLENKDMKEKMFSLISPSFSVSQLPPPPAQSIYQQPPVMQQRLPQTQNVLQSKLQEDREKLEARLKEAREIREQYKNLLE